MCFVWEKIWPKHLISGILHNDVSNTVVKLDRKKELTPIDSMVLDAFCAMQLLPSSQNLTLTFLAARLRHFQALAHTKSGSAWIFSGSNLQVYPGAALSMSFLCQDIVCKHDVMNIQHNDVNNMYNICYDMDCGLQYNMTETLHLFAYVLFIAKPKAVFGLRCS